MASRAECLADFITDADPPFGSVVEVLCEDHVGTYRLPWLCRSTPEGLRNERTGELIKALVSWLTRVDHEQSRLSKSSFPR